MSAGGASNSLLTIDLTSGPISQYLSVTLGLASSLFVFSLVLGLSVETFGRGPAAHRDYGGVVFRAVVVLVLLAFYARLFGSLFGIAEGIAARLAPHDVWDRFTAAQDRWVRGVEAGQTAGSPPGPALATGYLFDALLALALLLGQASLWIVNTFGRVLAALLYVLGPLALVFAIPRGVDTGTRWFRVFVSVLCWPALSGLLVSLTVSFGLQGAGGTAGAGAAFESVALAGLMAVISLAVPLVASSLVGGGFGAVSSGADALMTWSRPLASARAALPRLSRPEGG